MAAIEEEKFPPQLKFVFVVDKTQMRLVYAECDRFMADALFSFLVIPVGALIQRTHKDSGLGSMDNLHRSVENLSAVHFETPACRDMLLSPRSADGFPHQRLKIRINDADNEGPFSCPTRMHSKYSLIPAVRCECGEVMACLTHYSDPPPPTGDVVFIRGDFGSSFIVTDDLYIAPSSKLLKESLCAHVGVEDGSTSLEEQIYLVDSDKMVELMKRCLHSNTPLTDTFLSSDYVAKPINLPPHFLHQHLIKKKASSLQIVNKLRDALVNKITPIFGTSGSRKMAITLLHNRDKVVFVKMDRDFIDLLFSFLTIPFGSIIAAFGGSSPLGCLDNLHQVAKRFNSDGYFYAPDKYGCRLLNPSMAPHHICENHLLEIGTQLPLNAPLSCPSCKTNGFSVQCKDPQHSSICPWEPINPKKKGVSTTERGGGYVKWPAKFLMGSDGHVKPMYESESYQAMFSRCEEKPVAVGQKEALELLMAYLVSEDPFTDAFLADSTGKIKKNI